MSDAAKLAVLEDILFEPKEEGYDKPASYLSSPRYVIGQIVVVQRPGWQVERTVIVNRVPTKGDPHYLGHGSDGIYAFTEEEILRGAVSSEL